MELRIENLSKRYPNGVQALDGVTLTVKPGMFGLLGPNGAGKSTLMRTLATLQEADSGSAFLGDIDMLRDKEAVRRVLGYLPQDFGLYPKATAEELLTHLAALKGLSRWRERKETVAALLRQVHLDEVRHQRLGGFSGGMRQRFGIAQALLGSPRLLIVDEPTAGLDPEERVRFHNLLSDIAQDVVVLLSTHIVSDVRELCHQMAVLAGGRVLLAGQPSEVLARLEGRVWEATVDKGLRAQVEADPRVLSTRLRLGRLLVRAYGEQPPGPDYRPAAVDLEDAYFATIKGHVLAVPPAPALQAAS
jgi:ABC-type multidrug transport system ATPase subunit